MKKILLICIISFSGSLYAQQLPGFSSQSSAQSVCEGLSFNSDEDAFRKVKEICDAMDIAGNFMVSECSNVDNCKAVLNSSGSYIFYNNNYLKKIKGLNFTEASFKSSKNDDWDVLFILAHEIGHHVLQHLANFQQLSRIMPLVDMELEADKFAGACMFRLGASLEQAQHVMYDASVSEKASLNHPSRKERLDIVAIGYNKAKAKSQGIVTPPTSDEKVSEAITKIAEGKFDEAVSELERNSDNPASWGYLGYAYCSGNGAPKNMQKGIMYYTKAADAGDLLSQYNLATTYANGDGVPKDDLKAVKYYSMAVEQGDTSSELALAMLYLEGDVVVQNFTKARSYFEKLSAVNKPEAIYYLGKMYYDGSGVTVDFPKAIQYFEQAAKLNFAIAQFVIALFYENGFQYEKNLDEAKKWYKLAAKQENQEAIDACKRLGVNIVD